jgi:hypothetical protein
MIDAVDAFRAGQLALPKLVDDLHGLFAAADFHDSRLAAAWWEHEEPIDTELELRTEGWMGFMSDEELERALSDLQTWARGVLDSTDHERT